MVNNIEEIYRGFGRVFKGTLDKKAVAIKKMKHVTEKEKRRNMNEIGHLEKMNHANIVIYYKSYLESNEVWMIMELMEGGTLSEASQIYDFTDVHIAYVAREVIILIHLLIQSAYINICSINIYR